MESYGLIRESKTQATRIKQYNSQFIEVFINQHPPLDCSVEIRLISVIRDPILTQQNQVLNHQKRNKK